jgi:hypothetical protein
MSLLQLTIIASVFLTCSLGFGATYQTNAVAVLNDSVVPKPAAQLQPYPLETAQKMFQQLESNSLFYNNQDEINAFIQYVKKHKLEKQMATQLSRGIPRIQENIRLFANYKYFQDVFWGKQQGLLTPAEFQNVMTELRADKLIRAKRFPHSHREDDKLLQRAESEYAASRALHV